MVKLKFIIKDKSLVLRISECVDACIYTKRAGEKSTKLTKLASSNLDIGLYGNKKYRYIYVLNHK